MSRVFTAPLETLREPVDHRALLREAEEERLLGCAERAPLKARWRRSWKPDDIVRLASLYSCELRAAGAAPIADERLAVNFLRHERTAYDKLTSFPGGLQHGLYGSYELVYLAVKRRVHEKIAADFPWLETEAMTQFDEAEEAVTDGRWSAIIGH